MIFGRTQNSFQAIKRLFKYLLVPAVIFFLISLAAAVSPSQARPPVDITILHVNDTHGHILPLIEKGIDPERPVDGAAWLAGMIVQERENNPAGTLLLSGGDMFQGTAISNIFYGKPVIEIMNALKFDAMVVGNHEFDWGRDVLNEMRTEALFPFLAANVRDQAGAYLPGVKPCVLRERKGLKIAIIGVTTTEAAYTTRPANVKGLAFLDPRTVLPGWIRKAKSRGAKLIVVLSHSGLDADRRMAGEIPGIDVIVGGHSHTVVKDPVTVGRTIIVQAGCCGWYLGVLKLRVDPDSGEILHHTMQGELKKVFSGPDDPFDPGIARIVEKYEGRIRERFSAAVGETLVDLSRNSDGESNLGDLLCDAMKEAAGAGIAFQNSGGIRSNIPEGKITLEQAYSVLPFDNLLVSMDLTGKQILRLLERSALMEHGILQSSGIRVTYNLERPPGRRVVEAMVNGEPLSAEKAYRIVTNDFLAAGGDKFSAFRNGKNIRYGDDQREVFLRYLKKHSPVHPGVEGRILFQE